MKECEVLIVGGGPAGLLLALSLVQRGVDAVVLERRAAPTDHSRAIGLHPPALNALGAVGLASAAIAEGAQIRSGVAVGRGRRLGGLSFERAWPQRPFVLSLPQSRTEALLEARLSQIAPDALQRGWQVHGLEDHGGHAEVTAHGADSSASVTWRADVVVGADGARSTVRDLAGITTTLRTYRDTYLMGDVADAESEAGTAMIHLEPGGVVESFPLPARGRRWVAHTGTARDQHTPLQADAAALAALVGRRTGISIDPASSTMISAFRVRRRTARRMVRGRVVLVGDAAHEISPIGGQGITLGWLDALALAPLLETAAHQGLRCDLGLLPRFRRFERRRTSSARWAGLLAEANMALGRPLPVPLARARDAVLRVALGLPLRHWLARAYSMGWAWWWHARAGALAGPRSRPAGRAGSWCGCAR